ncbi:MULTISPECIES: TrkA family potassium uptake protein [unclassified Leptolyngbya]|uniref:potassium channel family protein n=1 Tax=unclassified Leptolyngbya TaxID=2650499 RepID=UPI00168878D5|nr:MULTISPECIES: TrkA family potassium uptake protein [unclassified Leptolyngbya]MBD1911627.1 TrkA family potassium uptake protein [Leptolyngbya sp. FACHB-8]MBD2153192.1 TrkA family potassium uptake protein [Leptolyngbya sp. FACHB-16]
MYVLIGGAGLIGLTLAQNLVKLGHTVAMIDIDPAACRRARDQLGVMAFEGSAVSTEALNEAGIQKADVVCAALRHDALNLAIVSLARHYDVPHIISRMRHRDFEQPLRHAGAHRIISTVDLAVSTMVNAVEYPQVESMMHFEQGQIEVLKLAIPSACHVIGRSIAEIAQDSRFPSNSLIIGYQPHPHLNLMVPNGATILEPESTVLVATKPESLHPVIDFLQECLPATRILN